MSETGSSNDSSGIAIVIPTRDRIEMLKRCLRQIMPYVEQHPECMVVVSDDGDAAQTSAGLGPEFKQVKVVQGPRCGPAANRNSGVAHSAGDLLIFLDDDCRPDPNLIEEYRRAASQYPECGVFEGWTSTDGTWQGFADAAPVNERGGFLWSCNFAIRRSLFLSIGGFDERFPFAAMEDVDMKFRLENKSQIRFLPRARVFHDVERRAGWRHLRHHSLSVILYIHLHGLKESGQGPWFFWVSLVGLVKRGLLDYLRRKLTKDLSHLVLTIWASTLILTITLLWRFHPYLAKRLFPACCAGCRSVHATLVER
jgi:GT2 family glycosyltransferase